MVDHDRIRVLWPDHLGLARGKYLPIRYAERGSYHCLSLFSLGYDRDMVPAPGTKMLEGLPDLHATFDMSEVRDGWEPNTGVVVADISHQGEPVAMSSRHALRRAVDAWKALGYHPKVGIELEAYILQRSDDGTRWVPWETPGGYVYGTGTAVDPIGLLDEIMREAEDANLPIESINSEYDIPQFELTLHYDDAMQAVDDAFLFKVLAREIAHRHGLLLTFLGRPLGDRGGSGLHVNVSFSDEHGTNVLNDDSSDDGLSQLARQAIAGMLEHHEGMAALLAPTVNAYKRLGPGTLTGYWANWGYDHRGVTVRVSPERGSALRLEHRTADGAANIYTAAATVLQAARLGVQKELALQPAETQDCLINTDAERTTPPSLRLALDALEADEELVDAVGRDLVEHFVVIKRAEWERFAKHVTDWELNEYLPFH
ncbi:MAG: glutamine synthetase family protein [Nitriliruptoraceae bacterium]